MKISEIFKEAVAYQWFHILLGRFYGDRKSRLPIKHTKREVAQNITFSWGFGAFVGINILVFIFFIFRYVNKVVPVIITLLVLLLLSLLLSSVVSCFYIFTAAYLELKESKKLEKKKKSK